MVPAKSFSTSLGIEKSWMPRERSGEGFDEHDRELSPGKRMTEPSADFFRKFLRVIISQFSQLHIELARIHFSQRSQRGASQRKERVHPSSENSCDRNCRHLEVKNAKRAKFVESAKKMDEILSKRLMPQASFCELEFHFFIASPYRTAHPAPKAAKSSFVFAMCGLCDLCEKCILYLFKERNEAPQRPSFAGRSEIIPNMRSCGTIGIADGSRMGKRTAQCHAGNQGQV